MTQKTTLPSDGTAVLGVINPDATAVGTHTTDWIAMKDFAALMAVIMAGTLGTAATLDAKLEQATDAAGTGAKDVTGSAITQLTKAADDGKQAVIQCYAEDLDIDNGFTHVRLSMAVGGATSDAGALVVGMTPRFGPASNADAATVAEIVTV